MSVLQLHYLSTDAHYLLELTGTSGSSGGSSRSKSWHTIKEHPAEIIDEVTVPASRLALGSAVADLSVSRSSSTPAHRYHSLLLLLEKIQVLTEESEKHLPPSTHTQASQLCQLFPPVEENAAETGKQHGNAKNKQNTDDQIRH